MQCDRTLMSVHLLLSIHRCGSPSKCASPIERGIHRRLDPSGVREPVFTPGITLPHQRPARQTHGQTRCFTTQGKASSTDGCSGRFRVGPGTSWCAPLFCGARPSGECVDSDGTSKQNRGEAMWALHSHGAPAQWIRLMRAEEGGVAVRPSLTGGDGLGLCQGPCRPEGPSDEGGREAEGRSGPWGSPIPGSATC